MFWGIVVVAALCILVSMCFGESALTAPAARVLEGALRESLDAPPHPLKTNRAHITPLTKKSVAAAQKLRCAACSKLLDETYEIDHIVPLFRGGGNDASNLQALHRSCHMFKSAVDARA